jgi:DNA polymerase-1
MQNGGLSKELATQVYTNYHNLYQVSDAWIKGILDTAHTTGYVTGAFGLKIRTPILAQTLVTTTKMPYMAKAERRSAGNAVTQSYGMLNSRAGMAFQKCVLASPYRLDILPVAQIHDAIYLLVRDDPKIVKWVNDNLVDCMRWQELPELQHDIVKLGANLDVYWPDWSTALTLPNDVPVEDIRDLALVHKQQMKGKM